MEQRLEGGFAAYALIHSLRDVNLGELLRGAQIVVDEPSNIIRFIFKRLSDIEPIQQELEREDVRVKFMDSCEYIYGIHNIDVCLEREKDPW
jgi:hypothetical protein